MQSLPCDDVSENTLDAESMDPCSVVLGHMASSAVVMIQSCTGIEDIMVQLGGRTDLDEVVIDWLLPVCR